MHCLELKLPNSKFTEVCSQGSNWWFVSIAFGNGLVPPGNKPLTEPMSTKMSWHHMTSLGHNELKGNMSHDKNLKNKQNTVMRKSGSAENSWSFNSLRPSDAIWWHRSGSTLAQVMACCLTAPSHYLNKCWLIITKVEWHSPEGNFTEDISAINHRNWLEKYSSKISLKSPRPQWVKTQEYSLCNLKIKTQHTLHQTTFIQWKLI